MTPGVLDQQLRQRCGADCGGVVRALFDLWWGRISPGVARTEWDGGVCPEDCKIFLAVSEAGCREWGFWHLFWVTGGAQKWKS